MTPAHVEAEKNISTAMVETKKPVFSLFILSALTLTLFFSCQTTTSSVRSMEYPIDNYAQSLHSYKKALDKIQTGEIKNACSDLEDSINLLSSYPDQTKDLAFLYVEKADCLTRLNNLPAAESNYLIAINLNPTNIRYRLMLGDFQRSRNKIDAALTTYKTILSLSQSNIEALFSTANIYDMKGDSDTAKEFYEKALQIRPDHPESAFNLMNIYIKTKQYHQAVKRFDQFPLSIRDNDFLLFELAYCMKKTGQNKRAVSLLSNVLENGRTDPAMILQELVENHYMLGNEAETITFINNLKETGRSSFLYDSLLKEIHSEDLPRTLSLFNQILSMDSMNILAHVARYRILLKMKETKPASEAAIQTGKVAFAEGNTSISSQYFSLAKSLQPKSTFPYTLMAMLYEDRGSLDNSVKEIESALRIQPTSSTLYQFLGSLYQQSGNLKKSYAALQKAYKYADENLELLLKLGYVASLMEKHTESLDYFHRAALQKPDDPEIILLPALGYINLSKFSNAIPYLEKMVSLNADSENVHYYLGMCYERTGKTDKAIQHFETALLMNPENTETMNYLAYLLIDRDLNHKKGFELITEALTIDSNNPTYLDTLGWAYHKLGDQKNALKNLTEAARIFTERNIKEPEVFEHIGDVYSSMNENTMAVTYWKKALSLDVKSQRLQKKISSQQQKQKAGN